MLVVILSVTALTVIIAVIVSKARAAVVAEGKVQGAVLGRGCR